MTNKPTDESGQSSGFAVRDDKVNGRDIYEVANQLGGFVGPTTDKFLRDFLLREEKAANDLAEEIVRLRKLVAALSTDAEPVKPAPSVAVKALDADDKNKELGLAARAMRQLADHGPDDDLRDGMRELSNRMFRVLNGLSASALSAQVQDVAETEADIVERMVKSIRDPFPSANLSVSRGIDGWRELMRDALRAAAPAAKQEPKVTASIKILVHYAHCCNGPIKFCDCASKNHGTTWIDQNSIADDYVMVTD